MGLRLLALPRPVKLYCLDSGERRAVLAFTVCNPGGAVGALDIVVELPGGYTVSMGPVDLGALGEGGCTTVVGEVPGEALDGLCGRAPRECYDYGRVAVESVPCFNLDRIAPLFAGRDCVFLCESGLGGLAYYVFSGVCGGGRACVVEAYLCGYYGQCGLAFARTYEPATDSVVNLHLSKTMSPYTALVVCWSGFYHATVSPPRGGFPFPGGRALVDLAWVSVRVDGGQVARYAVPVVVRGLRFGRSAVVGVAGAVAKPFSG